MDGFFNTLPDEDEFRENLDLQGSGTLIIFDDFFLQIEQHKNFFDNLFCINCHHLKISIILIVHNLFSKNLRTMTLNCHRFFLTQSMRDKLQLSNLARQAFPGKVDFILSAYENAMEKRFGHLCLDFSPRCRSELRVTADWFSQPAAITCYVYKDVGAGSAKKMGSNNFTKLVLVPFHRYSKLTSNDCHCSTSSQHSLSNSVHITRTPPRLPSVDVDPSFSNIPSENRKSTEEPKQTMVDEGLSPASSTISPPQPAINFPAKIEDHNQPTNPVDNALVPSPPTLPPPSPPPPPAIPNQLPPPPNSSLMDSRTQLHQELKNAIANRRDREVPRFINRPDPQPLPIDTDVRAALHKELKTAVAERGAARRGRGRRSLTNSRQGQKALTNVNQEQKAIEYSTSRGEIVQQPTPPRALENMHVREVPESIYPIALRRQDPDFAPPVKKTVKPAKRKPPQPPLFSPSPPIEYDGEPSRPAQPTNKRKGDHLTKPRPSQGKKVSKPNRGEKREGDFPLKPPKRVQKYPLWKI